MSKPVLAYLTGWGVRGDLLGQWLECFSDRFDLCTVNVPDLEAQRLLTPDERSELLAQHVSAPAIWVGWSLGGEFLLDLEQSIYTVVAEWVGATAGSRLMVQ